MEITRILCPQHAFKKFDTLDGQTNKARFGLSVACAGDINLDRIQDLVVGAPYDGADHKGAIYIFHGTKEGISEAYDQVIYANDIAPNILTFGWSLSAGQDLNDDHYPDILVGAY